MVRKIDRTPPPEGWTTPVWPAGERLMVPTDDGAELVVERTGPPENPCVVLVHGLTGNHNYWGPIAEDLVSRGFHVVGINQRGHGGSTVGTEGFGAQRQGADLGQILTAIDVRDAVVVGHSMGGLAAMSLMTLAPDAGADRVSGLVLVATLAHAVAADRDVALQIGSTKWYRRLVENPTHVTALARAVFGPTPSRAMVDDAVAFGEACPDDTSIAAALGMRGYDIRDLLSGIEVPTTVICGTRDLLTRHSENRAIAEAIPGAEFISVPGAGHMIVWEEPDLLVEAIAAMAGSDMPSVTR